MSTKAQREQQRRLQIERAGNAGETIRFFLDGGNDSKLETPNDGVKMMLGAISLLVTEEEYLALVDKAGYKLERTGWGTQRVVEK